MESRLFYNCFFCSDTELFPPCRRHLRPTCREWHLTFLLCYHVQCLTLFSGGSRLQMHLWLSNPLRYRMSYSKTFLGKLQKNTGECWRTVRVATITLAATQVDTSSGPLAAFWKPSPLMQWLCPRVGHSTCAISFGWMLTCVDLASIVLSSASGSALVV